MSGWAVVDVETTGLNPARDRVVEIGIIRLTDTGQHIDEWATLVNPGAVAAERIHGLNAADLAAAPGFAQLVGDVLCRLAGNVIVAHNAVFDVAFLQAETNRAGIAWGPVEGFCTMQVLMDLGLSKSRSLRASCKALGVTTGPEHVAIEDARAVAGLMAYLAPRLWSIEAPPPAPTWPPPDPTAVVRTRAQSRVARRASSRTLELAARARVPDGLGITDAAAATYLGLLDRIVEDGVVTDDEVDGLDTFARACGITRAIARKLHVAYLDQMSRLALADGVLTAEEIDHLQRLVVLLSRALPR